MKEERDKQMEIAGYFIEEEKKCPACGSKKISILETFQVWHERKLDGVKIYDKDYNKTPFGRVFHSYRCRKCGWESINFDE